MKREAEPRRAEEETGDELRGLSIGRGHPLLIGKRADDPPPRCHGNTACPEAVSETEENRSLQIKKLQLVPTH